MFKFNPLQEGATAYTKKATRLVGGLEIAVLEKIARRNDFRKLFDAEANFLERATITGTAGVPRLHEYITEGRQPTIIMDFIEGSQYVGFESGDSGEPNDFKMPEDMDLQLSVLPLYVLTMAGIIKNTRMVKPTDNKPLDIIIANRALDAVGDLVIIDWGFVEPATSPNVSSFLADSIRAFFWGKDNLTPAVAKSDPNYPLPSLMHYFLNVKSVEQLKRELPTSSNKEGVLSQLSMREAKLSDYRRELESWNKHTPDTPYKTIFLKLSEGAYPNHLDAFVKDVVNYYVWRDSVIGPEPAEAAIRQDTYRKILGWVGEKELPTLAPQSTLIGLEKLAADLNRSPATVFNVVKEAGIQRIRQGGDLYVDTSVIPQLTEKLK
jgi:hypothetical protein